MNRKEIKKLAKNKLKNNLWIMILCSLVITLPILASAFSVGKDIMPLVICNSIILISIGSGALSNIALKAVKDDKVDFKEGIGILKNIDKILVLDFVKYCATGLFIIICSLPLGLVMMYTIFVTYDFRILILVSLIYVLLVLSTYFIVSIFMSQKNYIISDFEDIKTFSVLSLNFTLLRKNILKYIGFELSFIGWFIISILTCGIGFLFLITYRQICLAYFYESIKENKLIDYKPSKNNKLAKIVLVSIVLIISNSIGLSYYSKLSEDDYMEFTDYAYVNIESEVEKIDDINIDSILEEDSVSTIHNSQICRIINQLEGNLYFSKMENTWKEPPYKMKIYYSANEVLGLDDYMEFWTEENTEGILYDNALVLMTMTDDLEQIEFILDEKEDSNYIFTRDELNKKYGIDLSKLKEDRKLFEEKIDLK